MKYDDVPFNPGYGVEPPRFAGRELVAQTILLGLQRGPGREEFLNIVTGGRGTGKTTLLNHLRRYVTSEWGWSTIKWAGRPSWPLAQLLAEESPRIEHELRSPSQKVRSALRPDSISARTPVGTITKNTEPNASLARSVTASLRQLGQLAEHDNRTIVLFVDELQAVSAVDLAELSGTLQIVTNEEALPVAVVAAGLPSTRKVIGSIPGTTFIERQDEHRLGNLSVDADISCALAGTAISASTFPASLIGFATTARASNMSRTPQPSNSQVARYDRVILIEREDCRVDSGPHFRSSGPACPSAPGVALGAVCGGAGTTDRRRRDQPGHRTARRHLLRTTIRTRRRPRCVPDARDRRGLVIARGEIWWADLPAPTGSGPGKRRPVLVVSADSFNLSRIGNVVAVAISSNLELAAAPGNVAVPANRSGLSKDSVANVSQIITLDKRQLGDRVGALDFDTLAQIEAGLRLALDLAS